MVNQKSFWVLKGEDWTMRCLSLAAPPPPTSVLFYRLLAFRPFMFGVCARFHCRSPWCRVCEVRLFGSRLSARASVSPPPVSSQIPNRLSKRCLKQKQNFYVLSSKKRRDAKTDKRRRKPCLAVVSPCCSASPWQGCLTAPERAHRERNWLCVSKRISCHARV